MVIRAKLYPEGIIELKKIFSLPVWSHKYFLTSIPLLLIAAGAGWYFYRQAGPRQSLAARVPASAIGYVEVASLSRWLVEIGETRTWRELAPAVGIDVRQLARWGNLAALTGEPELALLVEAQLALVVTGIEVGDGEVRPRLALIVETHRPDEATRVALEKWTRDLAGRLFGEVEPREDSYAGLPVVSYHPRRAGDVGSHPDRGLFAARVGSGWVLANHVDPLRQVLDAQLGRVPAMSGNFHWQQARRQLAGAAPGDEARRLSGIFGFITGEGVTRLLRSGSYVIANGPVARSLLAGAVGDIVTDLSTQVGEGIAISEEYGPEGGVTRYSLMLKPDLVERLAATVRPVASRTVSPALSILKPALESGLAGALEEVTIYRVESPFRTLGQVESAISARVGAAQSFVLHQFLVGLRETFLGIRDESLASAAIGDEIVEARYGSDAEGRLWLVAIRDRASMERLVEGYLTGAGAPNIRREIISGFEILDAGDSSPGGAVRMGEYIVLGAPALLRRLIQAQSVQPGEGVGGDPAWRAATDPALLPAASPLLIASELSNGPVDDLLRALAATGRLKSVPSLGRLPLASRTVRLGRAGLEIESRQPLGNFPAIFGLLLGGQDRDQSGE